MAALRCSAWKSDQPLNHGLMTSSFEVKAAGVNLMDIYAPRGIIIEAGMANEFGDRDVEVVMNLLFPEDASIFRSRQNGVYIEHPQTLTTDERLPPFPPRWAYVFQRVRISAGAAQVTYYVLSGVPPGRHRLLLRVGNQELAGGGPEVDLWISSGPNGVEVIDHL